MMNRAREKFLARAAFAQQQHRGIRRRHALGHRAGIFHRRMLADDARKSVAHRVFLAQQQILAQQFLLLRRALQKQFQMVQVHRLLNEIERAFLHRRDGFFHRAIRRHQNHGQSGFHLSRFAQHIQTGTAGKF